MMMMVVVEGELALGGWLVVASVQGRVWVWVWMDQVGTGFGAGVGVGVGVVLAMEISIIGDLGFLVGRERGRV